MKFLPWQTKPEWQIFVNGHSVLLSLTECAEALSFDVNS
jgi:hypothetical protein